VIVKNSTTRTNASFFKLQTELVVDLNSKELKKSVLALRIVALLNRNCIARVVRVGKNCIDRTAWKLRCRELMNDEECKCKDNLRRLSEPQKKFSRAKRITHTQMHFTPRAVLKSGNCGGVFSYLELHVDARDAPPNPIMSVIYPALHL
jgi:hypothetical protein